MSVRVLFALVLVALPLASAPVPKVAPKEGLIACIKREKDGDRVLVIKPDGTEVARIDGFGKEDSVYHLRLSHDGKRVAVRVTFFSKGSGLKPYNPGEIRVYDVAKPEKPMAVVAAELRAPTMAFGSDANTLFVGHSEWKPGEENRTVLNQVSRIDLSTGKAELLDELDGHLLTDVSADGKSLLVYRIGTEGESYVVDAVTKKMKLATKELTTLYRFSPDGTKALGNLPLGQPRKRQPSPAVVDLKTGDLTPVKDADGGGFNPLQWTPDGSKLLAYRLGETGRGGMRYVLCDPDGSNAKPFLEDKIVGLTIHDWR